MGQLVADFRVPDGEFAVLSSDFLIFMYVFV